MKRVPSVNRRARMALALAFGASALALGSALSLTAGPTNAAEIRHINAGAIATISYAPNSYVIGNAYPGWTDVIQGPPVFNQGPGNPQGQYYRWGYLYGPKFDRCGWIVDGTASGTTKVADECGTAQQQNTPYFLATFTDGRVSSGAGDGTHSQWIGGPGCTSAYGNVEPWRVPATPGDALSVDGTHPLYWRYETKDRQWVLVHDHATTAGNPNWYFVHAGCITEP